MAMKLTTTKRRTHTPTPSTPGCRQPEDDVERGLVSDDSERSTASSGMGAAAEGGSVWGFLLVVACLLLVLLASHTQSMMNVSRAWRWLAPSSGVQGGTENAAFVARAEDDADPSPRAANKEKKSAFKKPKVDGGRLPNFLGGGALAAGDLQVATWNVRTVQNPFAHYLAEEDARAAPLNAVVGRLEALIHSDTPRAVGTFFTEGMYDELRLRIAAVDTVSPCLDSRYKEYARMTPNQFLAALGDRGTIDEIDALTNPFSQSRGDVHYRPTPLGCGRDVEFAGGEWWGKWLEFMFSLDVTRKGLAGSVYGMMTSGTVPCVGGRTLALAVYDAMMKGLLDESGEDWGAVRSALCEHLHHNTTASVVSVLEARYASHDVVFLQGVTQALVDDLRDSDVGKRAYQIRTPSRFSPGHARNVAVLFKTGRFHGVTEFTGLVPELEQYAGRVVGFTASRLDEAGSKLALVSFAGDADMLHRLHDYLAGLPTPMRQVLIGCSSVLEEGAAERMEQFRGLARFAVGATSKVVKTFAQPRYSEATSLSERSKESNAVAEASDHIFFTRVDFTEVAGSVGGDLGAGTLPSWDRPVLHGVVAGALKPLSVKEIVRERSVSAVRMALLPVTEAPATEAPELQGTPQPDERKDLPDATGEPAVDKSGGGEEEATLPPAGEGFQLPPVGVGDYVNVPEGEMYPFDAAHDTSRITVTAVCDNGLGDRLGSLYSAIHLAYTLKARFHLMWNANNECRARASVLFQFDGSSSSVQNRSHTDNLEVKMQGHSKSFDAIITLKHHFSTGHLVAGGLGTVDPPAGDGRWESGEARKVSLEATGPLVTWAQNRQKQGKRVHILHHIDRLAKGVDLEGVNKAMKYYNFKINPRIMERVDSFCEKHKIHPLNTIGVHLRGTDARIPLRMNDVITDVRLRFPQRTFFVASDDKDAEGKFLSAFTGRAVSNTMKTHYPGKLFKDAPFRIQGVIGAGRFNVERGEPAVVDALTDMALLSRTERPIIDGVLKDSSFGKMSTTLCVIGLTCNEELADTARSVKAPARPGG